MRILGYETYGWNPDIFSIDQYKKINEFNRIVSNLKYIDYESNAILDIQRCFIFVKNFIQRHKLNCFHDYPLGHEFFDPVLKKIIFPEAKFIFSIREPKLLYDSMRSHYDLHSFSDEYFELLLNAYKSRYEIIKNQFNKDVLFYELGSGWESVCKFLEKKIPDQDFPYENKRGV